MDAKRSKVFAKIAREITIAARIGGGDPDMNPRLRLAVMKGRGSNMPADNIQRAIARGTGEGEGANFEELAYEIYGPHGVAILCEVATDNRNRTASEIRAILTRNEGKIATAGAVSRLFHRKGQILVARENLGAVQGRLWKSRVLKTPHSLSQRPSTECTMRREVEKEDRMASLEKLNLRLAWLCATRELNQFQVATDCLSKCLEEEDMATQRNEIHYV